jgi:hypothetical protein
VVGVDHPTYARMFLMSDADNSELVKLMLRRLDANDLSRLVELMSPDVEFANLLQLLGLFGINRNEDTAELTLRLTKMRVVRTKSPRVRN